MFDGLLAQEEKGLLNAAKDFGEAHFTEENIAQWCEDGGIPESVMRDYQDSSLGLLGLAPAYGGAKASLIAQVAIIEELTHCAGATLPLQSQILSFALASTIANKEQREMVLSYYRETAKPCFSTAISDISSGSDAGTFATHVREESGTMLLRGQKVFVVNGQFTPYVFTVARDLTEQKTDGAEGFSCWLLPTNAAGVKTFPIKKIGQSMVPSAAVQFDDVELRPEWRIGLQGQSKTFALAAMNMGRCVVCAASLGLARAAFEDASAFASERVIKGQRIGDFQQIGLMLADMASSIVSMEAHIGRAVTALNAGNDVGFSVSLMKKYVPAQAVCVADSAMQIYGGAGYTDSARVGRIWIDCRGNQFATGTDQVMANSVAHEIMKNKGLIFAN